MGYWMKTAAGTLLLAVVLVLTASGTAGPHLSSASTSSDGARAESSDRLPLGPSDLPESRDPAELAPGVTYTHIVRGEEDPKDIFSVEVDFFASEEEAREAADELSTAGYEPRLELVSGRPPDDVEDEPLGYRVRVGEFGSGDAATELQEQLAADGYEDSGVAYTGDDGEETTGPWVVNVLEVDPAEFGGELLPVLGNGVILGKELLTSISDRTGALAAINAGYFVVEPEDGTEGDLAGTSIVGGELVSEAVNGRTSLIFSPSAEARIAAVETEQTVTASGGARELDGLNRKPGLIRSCGGVGGDEPTEEPKHDFTCTDDSELVQFTPAFGETTEPGEGAEAVLDASGKVTEVRDRRGDTIPADGTVLSGIGEATNWLRENATLGARLEVSSEVLADGEPLEVDSSTGVVNGGPRLLSNGEPDITADAEGFNWAEDPSFYYAFGLNRNPRTLAGTKPDGTLLFVAIDGRQPGYSVGASFEESATVMQALGATEAVNLDGGGSTTVTIGDELVSSPSDDTGERPIGDALLILNRSALPDTGGETLYRSLGPGTPGSGP